jgi:hypothetical protein
MANEQAEAFIKELDVSKERKSQLRQMNHAISLLYVNRLITRTAMMSARKKFMTMLNFETMR